jgi:tRNA G10  N-methylase Trm11
VFIPGKNWRLSLAELVSFLEARRIKFEVRLFSKEFFVVSIEENADSFAIVDLGGFIKVGGVSLTFQTEVLKEAFLRRSRGIKAQIENELASGSLIEGMIERAKGKYLFGVSVYCAEDSLRPFSRIIQRFVGSSVKRELASHGVRSEFMGFSRVRTYPQLTHVEVLKKNLVENKGEVLVCIHRELTLLAVTVAVHDPFEFQKRDVFKPKQRKIFAMPPRLARIMVNLSSCTPGKILLDPFCGVGTILQEALLAKAKVVGVDLNPWCVKAAEENLEWLKREYRLEDAEYRVVQGDACNLRDKLTQEVNCIVTEPDLGPALRDIPTTPYAGKLIDKLKPLYHGFLEEASRTLRTGGRLVLVTPYVKTRSGRAVTMPVDERAAEVGLKKVYPFRKEVFAESNRVKENLVCTGSFVDVEERHKIGREIHVFQK